MKVLTKYMMMKQQTTTSLLTLITAIVALALMMTGPSVVLVLAQQPAGEVYQSEEDGFRLQVPADWVLEDYENTPDPVDPQIEDIAMLCLANEALPAVGGGSNCTIANRTDSIGIFRLPDLQSRPEFEESGGRIVPSTNDLVALYIQNLQNSNTTSDVRIVNSTDIDQFRKIANITYTFYSDAGTGFNPFDDYTQNSKALMMFALSPDNSTGYIIFNIRALEHEDPIFTQHKPAVQQILNSFEVVAAEEE